MLQQTWKSWADMSFGVGDWISELGKSDIRAIDHRAGFSPVTGSSKGFTW
jgi:hypothetical protein